MTSLAIIQIFVVYYKMLLFSLITNTDTDTDTRTHLGANSCNPVLHSERTPQRERDVTIRRTNCLEIGTLSKCSFVIYINVLIGFFLPPVEVLQ